VRRTEEPRFREGSEPNFEGLNKSVVGSTLFLNGGGELQVVEHPDAIKCVLVRWNGVKTDLTHLARLRWIEKKETPEICRIMDKSRSCVRASTRTLRKAGISELNLSPDERKLIEIQLIDEAAIYGGKYR
jgi:hypothetical protein